MRILVDLRVQREPPARVRKTRRLTYLAWIAHTLGHDVRVTHGGGNLASIRKGFGKWHDTPMLDLIASLPMVESDDAADLVLCSHTLVGNYDMTRVRVISFTENLAYDQQYAQAASQSHALVAFAWNANDYWNPAERPKLPMEDYAILSQRVFPVPLIPHETILETLHRMGLAEAYCTDNLQVIRDAFRSEKTIDFGFYGHWEPRGRSELCNALSVHPELTIVRTSGDRGNFLAGADYLRWLATCRASLNFPGDTQACSRFSEAAMLGVPNVCTVNQLAITPPLTKDNCILVDSWNNISAMQAGLRRADAIRTEADKAYCSGWSLRGQFSQLLKRIGMS